MKIKKNFSKLKNFKYNSLILFGLLSNLGVAFITIAIINLIEVLILTNLSEYIFYLIYIFLSIVIYFEIGSSKLFKGGYIVGFVAYTIGALLRIMFM